MKFFRWGVWILAIVFQVHTARAVLDLSAGISYRTLDSEHVRLRFPVERELEAREFLAWAEAHVNGMQERIGFRFPRRIVVYLTDRRYSNAYVSSGHFGEQTYMALPFYPPVFLGHWDGMDGSAYEIFVHEVAHYYQSELGRPWLDRLFGPTISLDSFLIPSWVKEGLAVHEETLPDRRKGRLRDSYFSSFIGSVRQERGFIESWDFYDENWRWFNLNSANYTVGSAFTDFLSRRYGEPAYHEFVEQSAHITFASDFKTAFGKSYATLLKEFNSELMAKPARETPAYEKPAWPDKVARIRSLVSYPDGSSSFVASYDDQLSQVIHLDPAGRELSRNVWRKVLREFVKPVWDVPEDAVPASDGSGFYFLTFNDSRDGVAQNGVLGRWNLRSGSLESLASVPTAIAAAFSPDGRQAWIVSRVMIQGRSIQRLEHWDLTTGSSVRIRDFSEFESLAHLQLSPDQKRLAFSATVTRGVWNVYLLDLADAKEKLIYASNGQSLKPRWVSDRQLAFLTDEDGHFDVKSIRLNGTDICTHTRSSWFVDQFFPLSEKRWIHSALEGRQYALHVSDNAGDSCRKIVPRIPKAAPVPAESLATVRQLESHNESTFPSVLIPVTYVLLPRFGSNDNLGFSALIQGEDPYKKISWQLDGTWLQEEDEFSGTVSAATSWFYPVNMWLGISTQPGFFYDYGDDQYQPRYQVGSWQMSYPFYQHAFSTELSYRGSGPGSQTAGMAVAHSFSTSALSALAGSRQRGFLLSEHAAFFPRFLGSDDPVNVFKLRQSAALPLTFARAHALNVSFTELFIQRPSGIHTARITGGGVALKLNEELRKFRRQALTTDVVIDLEGFRELAFRGNQAVKAQLDYDISFKRYEYGWMSVLDRLWFNPRFQNMGLRLFSNAATFVDRPRPDGALHSATGAVLEASFGVVEWAPPLSLEATFYKRWTDDKKVGATVDLSGAFIF